MWRFVRGSGSGSTSSTKQQLQRPQLFKEGGLSIPQISCQRYSLKDIKAATQKFNDELVVGEGGFAKVYRGCIDNKIVAVKRLTSVSKQSEDEFEREIKIISSLRHVHLVLLIGYCIEGNEMIFVYEFMPCGTLEEHLYMENKDGIDPPISPLSWVTRLNICIESARGLDYLHTGTKPGVIHRDVKVSNILLDAGFVAKIADFGLAKLESIDQSQSNVSKNFKGTFGYFPPELCLTNKRDVYSFGVVLLVVLTGRPALDERLKKDSTSLVWYAKRCMEENKAEHIIDPYLDKEIKSNSLQVFIKVVKNCLLEQPEERPDMTQVVADLRLALKYQQEVPSSTSQEADDNQVVDPISDQRDTDTGSDCSITKLPPLFASISKPDRRLEQHVSGNSTILGEGSDFKRGRNGYSTLQKIEPKLYKPQNEVYHGESSMVSQWSSDEDGMGQYVPFDGAHRVYETNPQNVVYQEESSKISHPSSIEKRIKLFSFESLMKATNNFSRYRKIGEGDSGIFYEGRLAGPGGSESLVSVKKLNILRSLNPSQYELHVQEKLSHPNLLNLMGYCVENHEFLWVHEFMKNGSLDKHLCPRSDSGVQPLSWGLRLKICCDVARGLAFMHSLEKPIIHNNLMVTKILLDEFYNAKIGGFSSSVLDPTVIKSRVHISRERDVHSFGFILLQILTGLRPFDLCRRPDQSMLIEWAIDSFSNKTNLSMMMDARLEGKYSMRSAEELAELTLWCISEEPEMRPSMGEVLKTLEHIESTGKHRTSDNSHY